MAHLILTSAGYQVIQAADGEAAIEIIEKRGDEIDLALLDVVLPKAGGHLIYERIEALHPDLPVVFMTGYSRGLLSKIFSNHTYEILQKPFNRARLLNKVKEAAVRLSFFYISVDNLFITTGFPKFFKPAVESISLFFIFKCHPIVA